jgi:hypothetical protein
MKAKKCGENFYFFSLNDEEAATSSRGQQEQKSLKYYFICGACTSDALYVDSVLPNSLLTSRN